jgi:hypothetical protein
MQSVGFGGLVVVLLTHVAERFQLFPAMGWGRPDSPGHYIDLVSALVALVLLPWGYALRKQARCRNPG